MAAINVSELLGKMSAAAGGVLKEKWPAAEAYADEEFRKLAGTLLFIQTEVLAGRMSEKKARLHLDIQRNSARTVLLTLEGLGLIAVEEAINAALAVVRDTVNTAVGFVLV